MAAENISNLKLIEKGVSKEKLSLLSIPLVPYSIIPLKPYIHVLPVRLLFTLLVALVIYLTPKFREQNGEFALNFYLILLCVSAMQTLVETVMFISQMAFFASISDASIGGTYMTLLATLSNLGGTYPSTVALYLLNFFSKKSCLIINLAAGFNSTQSFNSTFLMPIFNESSVLTDNKCSSSNDIKECKKMGGDCTTEFDAFYVLVGVFFLIGVAVFYFNTQNTKRSISSFNCSWLVSESADKGTIEKINSTNNLERCLNQNNYFLAPDT
ncbi:acetyl-coenzyme A transporter 1 [Brachionus plicatilis]|uniref:Acetyl-coenzyme A transporter 1 n=1 Tax=Brachionus plicatilis TaxID=10195 RepID=A0A3M7PX62_BRAPC|nr:acetyl-coenzyme A transporter 1 [Brachionus plicatilis]